MDLIFTEITTINTIENEKQHLTFAEKFDSSYHEGECPTQRDILQQLSV